MYNVHTMYHIAVQKKEGNGHLLSLNLAFRRIKRYGGKRRRQAAVRRIKVAQPWYPPWPQPRGCHYIAMSVRMSVRASKKSSQLTVCLWCVHMSCSITGLPIHNFTYVKIDRHETTIHHFFNCQLFPKGQIISKANFEVFIWTKNRSKIFLYFCPRSLKWIKSKKNTNYYIRW